MLTTEITRPKVVTVRSTSARWRAVVIGLAVLMLFFQLGTRGLSEPDEGRYAEIGREMAATGDWFVPRLNGVAHPSKPPITYWLIALSIRVFGVNEFAARLPAALAGLGTLVAVYLLVRSAWDDDERVSLWAVVVLLTCVEFAVVARLITPDMILTCFVAWSVWCFWRWYVSADRPWGTILWFYVFLGLAMMTKGPIGVVLPLFAVFGLRWRNANLKLRQMHWSKGALVFALISAPWFVALAWRQPGLWNYFLVRELFERVATGNLHRGKPIWFFVPIMLMGSWPWTALLPALARTPCNTTRQRELARLCMAWWALGLVLFTMSRSKLPTYVVPLYAPVAVLVAPLIAGAVAAFDDRASGAIRRYALVAIVLQAATIIALAWFAHTRYSLPERTSTGLVLVAAAGGAIAAASTLRGRLGAAAGAFVATTCVVQIIAIAGFETIECHLGPQASGKIIGQRIRADDPGNHAGVVTYRASINSLPFYSGHSVLWCHPQGAFGADVEMSVDSRSDASAQIGSLTENDLRALLTGQQRVFCVTGIRSIENVHALAGRPLSVLQQCGPWALLSNQPSAP